MYNHRSYFNSEAGRGSIYKSPPKSKPKTNANQQAARTMRSVGIGGIGGKTTTSSAKKIQDRFREQTQKDNRKGSTYDEIVLPSEEKVDKKIKGLGAPTFGPDKDDDQSPIERIKTTLNSVSEMMGLGKPERPKQVVYTPQNVYDTAAFRARASSRNPIDFDAQQRRFDAALDFENRTPMYSFPVGGTYDEMKKQKGADERNQKQMAESINATIEQLYAANDPARQFYQSGVPMEQRIFEPELGYDEITLPAGATIDKKIAGLGEKKKEYTVKSGDTLSEIAQKNNTTVEELVRINNIEDKNIINVGQKIKLEDYVPEVEPVVVPEYEGTPPEFVQQTGADSYETADDMTELEILARTIQAEAGGESRKGKLAVGAVIKNRADQNRFGTDIRSVILYPSQFSPWNTYTNSEGGEQGKDMLGEKMIPSAESYEVAKEILSGEYTDPTNNATHFVNPKISKPNWYKGFKDNGIVKIGRHEFGDADK